MHPSERETPEKSPISRRLVCVYSLGESRLMQIALSRCHLELDDGHTQFEGIPHIVHRLHINGSSFGVSSSTISSSSTQTVDSSFHDVFKSQHFRFYHLFRCICQCTKFRFRRKFDGRELPVSAIVSSAAKNSSSNRFRWNYARQSRCDGNNWRPGKCIQSEWPLIGRIGTNQSNISTNWTDGNWRRFELSRTTRWSVGEWKSCAWIRN